MIYQRKREILSLNSLGNKQNEDRFAPIFFSILL